MQTIQSFLNKIDSRLVDRVIPHRRGYVSDLLFNGFDTTLVLLLPIPTNSGWISWSDLAQHHDRLVTASTSLSDLFFPKPIPPDLYFSHGTIDNPGYTKRLSQTLALADAPGSWTSAYWEGYEEFTSQDTTIGPNQSFLRPEPYTIIRQSLSSWAEHTADLGRLPSILSSPNMHFVATQPIYADRIYVSCTNFLAAQLIKSLPDIHPVSPNSSLPSSS